MPNGVTLDPASPVIKKGEVEAKLTLKERGRRLSG
jgi:hypothetical protein